MSSEAELIINIWENLRDHLPAGKRADLSRDLLYAFAEYGFAASDLVDIVDEDPDLAEAYNEVYEISPDNDYDEYEE